MASTGELRLLSELSEGPTERLEPEISEEGQVTYPEAEDLLTPRDETSVETLASLAERGLLHQEYTTKVYVCPSCQNEGMQFITACPFCEETHTTSTTFFEHSHCDYTAESIEFETKDGTGTEHCPNCEKEIHSSELVIDQKNICKECGESFETPSHRLWCLNCLHLCPPEKATEQTIYEYELTENGEIWYESQIRARKLLSDEFSSRGFDVDTDTEVKGEGDEVYPVHLHAEDDLLNQEVVADIHAAVDTDKLQYISDAAEVIQARPFLLATDSSIPDDVLQVANQYDVTLLWINEDGTLRRYDSIDTEYQSEGNIIGRLSSAVGFTTRKGD